MGSYGEAGRIRMECLDLYTDLLWQTTHVTQLLHAIGTRSERCPGVAVPLVCLMLVWEHNHALMIMPGRTSTGATEARYCTGATDVGSRQRPCLMDQNAAKAEAVFGPFPRNR